VEGDVSDMERLEELIKNAHMTMVTIESKEYNEKIREIVEKHHKLLNLANDAERTDVVIPIDSKIDSIRVAVTTEGKSGMVAREALFRIAEFLKGDEELNNLTELMYMVKSIIKERIAPKERMEIYHEVFNNPLLREVLRSKDLDRARTIVLNILKDHGIDGLGRDS
ncbi:MAG: hypothetical protein RMJ31_07770, partial [Nitrososphaerota archaeon]|nr:hypothetical protein [Nitrososphaerota archaeon]